MEVFHGGYSPVASPEIREGKYAKFKHPTHQINLCTPAALECLTFITSEEVEK
ncbi:hypothetical protein M2138_001304 [Dysgonomonadaceae bacterium PH5-43]|nr:hypothetical protein [Dysgonomonadaceae bacterium PH5-43]